MEDWLRNEEYRERERVYVEEYNRRLYETIPLFFSIRVLAIFRASRTDCNFARVAAMSSKFTSEAEGTSGNERMSGRNERRKSKQKGAEGLEKERALRDVLVVWARDDEEEELRESERARDVEGNRLWGRWWSAVVHCKSPSTAFNYDVIANTDDGYFLRYTLYITRGPTAPRSRARTEGRV